MTPKIFLSYLPLLRKSNEYLLSKNLLEDGEYIKSDIRGTTPQYRSPRRTFYGAPAAVQELYGEYELWNIELMSVFFEKDPIKLEQGWQVANMSEDLIVVGKDERVHGYMAHPIPEIHGEGYHGVIAKDLEAFLEALLCAQLLKMHFNSGDPEEPSIKAKSVHIAGLCTEIAGGEEYKMFWYSLLWAD